MIADTPEFRGKVYAARMRLAGELLALTLDPPEENLDPLTDEDRQVLAAAGVDVAAEMARAKGGA